MEKVNYDNKKIIIPRYSPGTPPKNYKEKKAVSLFCCLKFSFGAKCPELLRAVISKKGDVYIIPYVEYGSRGFSNFPGDFHLSHHKSGKFHWTTKKEHIEPVYGEKDFAAAFGLWLKLRHPPCFCFRRGSGLNEQEITSLLNRLAQNIPFVFDIESSSKDLGSQNYHRLVLPL